MRQISSWLVGFVLLLGTLPLAAQTGPPALFPAAETGASCPAEAGAALPDGTPGISLPEEIGVPNPIPMACESNYCHLARGYCETTCSPCSFDFSCKGRTCESICTCTC
jgi:hypothetical protein